MYQLTVRQPYSVATLTSSITTYLTKIDSIEIAMINDAFITVVVSAPPAITVELTTPVINVTVADKILEIHDSGLPDDAQAFLAPHIGPTPPANPFVGKIWIDTNI